MRLALAAALLAAAPPPASSSRAQTEKAGYWLSVDLIGPASARAEAAFALSASTDPRSPRDGRLPGQAVGHVADIYAVIDWLEVNAFPPTQTPLPLDPAALTEAPAPRVAGTLHETYGVQLRAMVVTGATAQGDRRTIDWPADGGRILPPDSQWHVAALLPSAAPLFAAPSARVPPASERFAMARRRGDVFVVGMLDRCTDAAPVACTRWAQVVVRDGDRFVPGYLPASQVALRSRWKTTSETRLPRAQLVRVGVRKDQALHVLVARDAAGALHRRTIEAPLVRGSAASGFPEVSFEVQGDIATVTFGAEPLSYRLDATLDARVVEPSPDAAPTPTP
ncbi:MAG: hypothetical protein AAGA54_30650 [Myxococcota bacterium]